MEALGSDLPRLEFVDLLAGFELFTRTGTALPEATIECVVYKLGCEKEIWTCVDRVHHRALREQDCALFGAVRSVHTLKGCLERSDFLLTEFRNIARRRKGCSGIHPPSSLSVRNSTSMPTSDRYYP